MQTNPIKRLFNALVKALKQTWLSRDFIVNPFVVFLLFLKPSMLGRNYLYSFGRKDIRFFFRWIDWVGVEEIILRGEYDEVLSTLKNLNAPVVLDLGANIGAFSIKAFMYNSTCAVFSVEPSHATYILLQKNRFRNPQFNWKIFEYAIWDRSGIMGFNDNPQASTASRLVDFQSENVVPTIRLADFIQKNITGPIDMVKMDIEGAEESVLFDNLDLLDTIKILILEIHPAVSDEQKTREVLYRKYAYVYEILGRQSEKPLLVCSKTSLELRNAKEVKY